MAALHLGIDVRVDRLFVVAIDEDHQQVRIEGVLGPSELSHALKGLRPESVAIDAPNGLSRAPRRRVAEIELGIGGCYATPGDRSLLPPWMEAGLAAHEQSAALLDEGAPHVDGKGQVVEVHPTYGFKSLLGLA